MTSKGSQQDEDSSHRIALISAMKFCLVSFIPGTGFKDCLLFSPLSLGDFVPF